MAANLEIQAGHGVSHHGADSMERRLFSDNVGGLGKFCDSLNIIKAKSLPLFSHMMFVRNQCIFRKNSHSLSEESLTQVEELKYVALVHK